MHEEANFLATSATRDTFLALAHAVEHGGFVIGHQTLKGAECIDSLEYYIHQYFEARILEALIINGE
jgi:hypothetical protein